MSTVTVPETGLFASINGKLLLRLQFNCCANTFRPQKVMPSKIKRQTHMMNSNNSTSNRRAAAKQGAGSKERQLSRCRTQISWPEALSARFKVGSPCIYVYGLMKKLKETGNRPKWPEISLWESWHRFLFQLCVYWS